MQLDITVAIPTYNGANRLPQVLERLRSQVNTAAIAWEILVVDNNSTDQTAEVIRTYQANWSANWPANWPQAVPLRYCLEAEQGAAFARQRAAREANGALIAFLDDDNLPDANWLAAIYTFSQHCPQAGAFGGQIHGEFEVEPAEPIGRILPFLSIREHGPKPYRFNPDKLQLPTSAALVIRKQAWQESIPDRPILRGRTGKSLLAGEDYELMLHLHKQGWEIWYNPDMHSYHQIPKQRLERDYLLALSHGCGATTCQLLLINAKPWQIPIVMTRTLAGNLRRILLHLLKHRNQVQTSLIPACELAFYYGSFMSPFYAIQNHFRGFLKN